MKQQDDIPDFFTQSPIALSPIDKVMWLKGWMIITRSRVLEPYETAIHRAMILIETGTGYDAEANRLRRDAVEIMDKAVRAAYAFRCSNKDKGQKLLVQLGSVIQCISHRRIDEALNGRGNPFLISEANSSRSVN